MCIMCVVYVCALERFSVCDRKRLSACGTRECIYT